MRTHKLISALLVVTLIITGLLAWQAISTTYSKQQAVEEALGDQLEFASWIMMQRFNGRLANHGRIMLQYVYTLIEQEENGLVFAEDVDDPDYFSLADEAQCGFCREYKLEPIKGLFFYDREEVRLVLRENNIRFSNDFDERLKHKIIEYPRIRTTDRPVQFFHLRDRQEDLLVVFRRSDFGAGSPDHVQAGAVVPLDAINQIFDDILTTQELLPESVRGNRGNRELLHVDVFTPGGDSLYQTGIAESETDYIADNILGEGYEALFSGNLAIRNYGSSDAMTLGGPLAPSPLKTGTLFGLAAVLGLVAFWLYRKQHALATMRTSFVSNVSHELRTPITQIRMFAETLRNGRVQTEADRSRAMEIIEHESRRLTYLISNILDFSRYQYQRQQVSIRESPVHDAVREAVEAYKPLAATEDVNVITILEPVEARTDNYLIRQIVTNLVDNAVKYGPEGQSVRVGLEADPVRPELFRLYVEDEGPGIPEKDLKNIWNPYWRSAEWVTQNKTGVGIGLSLVSDYVISLQGTIKVQNRPEGGAVFTAILPGRIATGSEAEMMEQTEVPETV